MFAGCLLADKAGDGAEELRKLASPKLHVIQLDVTKQGDWDKCKEYIKKNTRCGEYYLYSEYRLLDHQLL